MNLQTIIDEADIRVPNAFSVDQKVDWLNEVNHEFFDVVKIPKSFTASTNGTASSFPVANDMREKNIKKVVVGSTYYRSMLYENVTAAFNYYTLDEGANSLTLSPKPPASTLIVVYDKISVSPFLASNLTAEPEAPSEYHWLYILGLCVRVAKAMNDASLANNYENDFKNNLAVAQQNYLRG
jgi:hypothetical protein